MCIIAIWIFRNKFLLDLAHNGAADRGNIDSVFHNDVQLDGNGAVLVIGDLHALAHGFPPQQVHQAVGHTAVGHALDAEAVGGCRAGDGGEYRAADGNLALIGSDLNHS